jgi:hypothetical protein
VLIDFLVARFGEAPDWDRFDGPKPGFGRAA